MEKAIRTSVTVPRRVWLLLRMLAESRSIETGGRPNASAVLAELVKAEAERKGKGSDA